MESFSIDKKLNNIKKKFDNELVYINNSNIENAGYGVFAKDFIKKNTKLGEYIGKRYDDMNIMNSKTKDTNYFFEVNDHKNKKKFILDAKPLKYANFSRFINGVFTADQYPNQNCKFYQNRGKILVKAIKDINKDDELLIYYGDNYKL